MENPEQARSAASGLHVMEVFPALALLSLDTSFCSRLGAPKYNPGRRKTFRLPDPLTPEEMIRHFDRHKIPAHMIESGQVASWNTPWILQDARKFASPVRYTHKSGAVTWVKLDPEVTEQIEWQMMTVAQ